MSWGPKNAKAAVMLSFDNLGETADLTLGLRVDDGQRGNHRTASHVVPDLIAQLGDQAATFFIEGASAVVYPDTVQALAAAGHEVAYHSYNHHIWAQMSADDMAQDLQQGRAVMEGLGISPQGFRPPGGGLGEQGAALLKQAGFTYASPLGHTSHIDEAGLAEVPFSWRGVDAYYFEDGMAPVRKHKGDPEGLMSADDWFTRAMELVDRTVQQGGATALIFHLFLLDPEAEGGTDRLKAFDRIVSALQARDDVWLATGAEIAAALPGVNEAA